MMCIVTAILVSQWIKVNLCDSVARIKEANHDKHHRFSAARRRGYGATSCENLASVKFTDATITSAVVVPEGPSSGDRQAGARAWWRQRAARGGAAPQGQRACAPRPNIPAHCRVQMVLKPTSDSLINMEMWLPTENWNGKFMGVGNGGFAGSIQGLNNDMPQAIRLGYATAGTDTGHQDTRRKLGHRTSMKR
jgi:feruloyl esterase